jgi:hypothetical protein
MRINAFCIAACAAALMATLNGCAPARVIIIGWHTYLISVRVPYAAWTTGAQSDALLEANKYCAAQNKRMQLRTAQYTIVTDSNDCCRGEIIFLCLSEHDPRYKAGATPAVAPGN